MTSKLPFMKFYPSDFFNDPKVRHLRDVPGCLTAYSVLLALFWMDGGATPDDPVDIARQLQIEVEDWRRYREVLIARGLIEETVDKGTGETLLSQGRIVRDLERAFNQYNARVGGAEKARAKKEAKAQKKKQKSRPHENTNTDDQNKSDTDHLANQNQTFSAPEMSENNHEPSAGVERGSGGEKKSERIVAEENQGLESRKIAPSNRKGATLSEIAAEIASRV